MRVLHIYRDHFSDLPGGIERHIYDVAQGLAHRYKMEVVASGRTTSSVTGKNGVVLHSVREYGRPAGVPIAPGILSRARNGYEVVHIHSPNPTGELAGLRVRRGTPVVATYHADVTRGSRLYPAYSRFLRWMMSDCDRVIVASKRLIDSSSVLSRVAERSGRIEVVPFGVDIDHFKPSPDGSATPGIPTVLFVGRLRYYKGLPYLLEALAELDARLFIVGDGEDRHRIDSEAKERLGDRYRRIARASEEELVNIYRTATVFCLPSTSRAEAFGLAALEAMASGLPVITTEVGTATSEINVDGVTGRVVPPSDAHALREAIQAILEDHNLRARMGRAARERVIDTYDKRQMLQRISDIYESVCAERKR